MITLVLAFHNHQPVGNFGWVIEEAYQKSYLPLLEMLMEYPSIRFGEHYTGILLDWFCEHHPEFVEMIGRSVDRGQVELLSGGYYEPIMAMLPERDRHAQIVKLNERIEREFGASPTGMWLAERVWEPSLPSTLHDASIRYTILDDTHFKSAGLEDRDLTGYFLTEDQGKPLAVFPIDKRLRYTMPFEAPEATFDYLKGLDREGTDRVVVFADDGEKFGVWPDTYRTVYEHGWLRRFCELLVTNSSWVRTLPPGEVVATMRPAGRLYLPTASYAEMLHWALPTAEAFTAYDAFEHRLKDAKLLDRYGSFVRGGFWRNFMVKYPEVNGMQKKMLRVSERIDRIRRSLPATSGADSAAKPGSIEGKLEGAYHHLMAAQCNCPYWHGVFGGLYLANIRSSMFREMIAAERALDAIEGVTEGMVSEVDYDLDGYSELIYESPKINLYLAPAVGGAIFEFDYKDVGYNFTDLLQRRREGYHARLAGLSDEKAPHEERIEEGTEYDAATGGRSSHHEEVSRPHEDSATDAHRSPEGTHAASKSAGDGSSAEEARSIHDIVRVKEAGLEKALIYDAYRHGLLIDHFYGAATSASALRQARLEELGDFVAAPYEHSWERREGTTTITLRREGSLRGAQPVLVEKAVSIEDGSPDIRIEYHVRSLDGRPIRERFGIELAYTMSAGTEPDRYYEIDGIRPPEHGGRLDGVGEGVGRKIALVDEWLGVTITVELERPAVILRSPIETVSLSEEGFERNYQGSIVVPVWDLEGASDWRMTLVQRVEKPFG